MSEVLKNHKTSACQRRHTTCMPNSASFYQLPNSIVKAIRYIETNLTEEFSLDKVAKCACLSKSQFCRLFKQKMGMTSQKYRDNVRVDRAKSMLEDTNYKITDIAYDCGYSSHHDFRRVFKVICEITPTEYRLKHRTKWQ